MTWVYGTEWRHDPAREMAALLSNPYRTASEILGILEDVGQSGLMPGSVDRPDLCWYKIIRELHRHGNLPKLLQYAVDQNPSLRQQIDRLSADPPSAAGNPADRYDVLLANYGQVPIVNRDSFRNALRNFVDNRAPVLIVNGFPQSGKTHSFELLKHVLSGCDEPKHVLIDFSSLISGESAEDLMAIMRYRLGLRRRDPENPRTGTALHRTLELAHEFVGEYNSSSNLCRRILVIDGLDRYDVDDDVLILASALISECADQQLEGCQLLITGYRGELNPRVETSVQRDDTSSITEADVRTFFTKLFVELGREPEAAALDALIADAMHHVSVQDLRSASLAIRHASLELIGQS